MFQCVFVHARARVGTRRSSPSRAVTVQWQCASTEAQLVWVLSAVAAMDRKTGSALGTAKTARPLPCSRHPAPLVGNPPVWRSAARAPSADSSGNGVRALPPRGRLRPHPVGNRRLEECVESGSSADQGTLGAPNDGAAQRRAAPSFGIVIETMFEEWCALARNAGNS